MLNPHLEQIVDTTETEHYSNKMTEPDMDVIKEMPGYKQILKSVLKSQIQQLVSV